MKLSEVDLNLLLLFQRLMQERRVSTVAEQMNMSPASATPSPNCVDGSVTRCSCVGRAE
jgi:hypothetical protein